MTIMPESWTMEEIMRESLTMPENLEKIAAIVVAVVVGFFVVIWLLKLLARVVCRRMYLGLLPRDSPLDVDGFVSTDPYGKGKANHVKIVVMNKMAVGGHKPWSGVLKLRYEESPHVKGLRVSRRRYEAGETPHVPQHGASPATSSGPAKLLEFPSGEKKIPPPIVIGTIRMGFGHHRIAYAASSWAMAASQSKTGGVAAGPTYFHDFLNIDSPEADLITSADKMYSKMSRITSNLGGIFERIWGSFTLSGDGDALRITALTGLHLGPILRDIPRDTPIIASHSLVALTAVAEGFTNVINLVIDNHAQWFVVCPGCLNLVQGPVNYQSFLRMGVPPQNVQLAGHWIGKELVDAIPDDCARRMARAHCGTSAGKGTRRPRRLLIPVGGAGAQRKFIVEFVRALAPLVKAGDVQLFLNAGDHSHMRQAFTHVLSAVGLSDSTETVTSAQGVLDFRAALLDGVSEPAKPVTLFTFDDYFPAVATTDILSRVTDVLACKPSELAFYPVPKLMIRRVGDHEQYSALRAAELGDGTLEAREVSDAMINVQTFVQRPEILLQMNQAIITNNAAGAYDGCKNAVSIALQKWQAASSSAAKKDA